jgi:hypothetical protein
MTTKNQETEKEEKKSGAEKPVSLRGASFTEVLAALLKTKPIPKGKKGQIKCRTGIITSTP